MSSKPVQYCVRLLDKLLVAAIAERQVRSIRREKDIMAHLLEFDGQWN